MRIEVSEAVTIYESRVISLEELARRSGLSGAELEALISQQTLSPVDPEASPLEFPVECLHLARAACRLRDDLELDPHALAIVLALVERVRSLEGELRRFRAVGSVRR